MKLLDEIVDVLQDKNDIRYFKIPKNALNESIYFLNNYPGIRFTEKNLISRGYSLLNAAIKNYHEGYVKFRNILNKKIGIIEYKDNFDNFDKFVEEYLKE